MESKVAVIGGKDYLLGFKALGVSVFPVKTGEEASQALAEAFPSPRINV